MPAVSKKQFRFMAMMAKNPEKARKSDGPSQEQAKEYISHNKGSMSYKNLPEKSKKRKFKSL